MQRNNRATLTEGLIKSTLTKLTIPMVFGIIGFVIFNLVDTFYVGQLGIKYSQIFAIGWGTLMFVLFLLLGKSVATLANATTGIASYLWLRKIISKTSLAEPGPLKHLRLPKVAGADG